MIANNTLTYISLFSSAGVGCYGFKQAGFECIATNELIHRRLNIQKINKKCKYPDGYIEGDITKEETKGLIFNEIKKWESEGNDKVDVVIATPPCQGMSVANHKKADNEIIRNSLVVESVEIIKKIKPRFFLFENVSAFWKTGCTAPDGSIKAIGQVIMEELGTDYIIMNQILNFKNYGANSSRTRTVVIGVEKHLAEFIAPVELFPTYRQEKVLRDVIGHLPELDWGQFAPEDFYHQFRTYPEEMRKWIHDLKEGESAFDNEEVEKRPHKVINNTIVQNQRKNGDKYTRQVWSKVAPCIHTRNDQLASQNTVHPKEDRVFTIRELMELMTIPYDFKWCDMELKKLNKLSLEEKSALLKKEEINIRQSIGEAVPTTIFYQIACNIKKFITQNHLSAQEINKIIINYDLKSIKKLKKFIKQNELNLGNATLARIAELVNSKRENNSAYFTNKFIVNEIFKELPDFEKEEIHVIEPSVGVGNFLPFIFKKYESIPSVNIDVVDIDKDALEILKLLLEKMEIPDNIHLKFVNTDSLKYREKHYDLTIGNPPFTKMKATDVKDYMEFNVNKATTNLYEFFLEKAVQTSDFVAMITPKALLNTPEFETTRKMLEQLRVEGIIDFGENGFKGVLVETICILVNTRNKPYKTKIKSLTLNIELEQKQNYIFDNRFPYWIIYRNTFFDKIAKKMEFNIFSVFRDRQITNTNSILEKKKGFIRVLKSRNISDDGTEILAIEGYDAYMERTEAEKLAVYKYFNDLNVYLTPNMTYKPRVTKMKPDIIVNGSVAILIPKKPVDLTEYQMKYFSTGEYREFYKIARNYQTRSLNVDSNSCFWFGRLAKEEDII
ncbi:DNA (cytosine-5-)-methyltransferase [Anaerocolumna sp. MB42-C2]|uniref:DNA (cytosine-5-)-methyltransferase n=1 Tax=Anaerocolumna sp. MB42-C2 TaxID=3070997 RepID=UPI0027E0D124|nr:DNA (cytosine-5-)-methyltransferase [Anaerocolumna sp. MB42-C2]WMJ85382.1 DNA (cytosine-5-)-methyltransferase [Anaerocolumna sp. MB42-C2]